MPGLDAHARPPEWLRVKYKTYQKISTHELLADPDVVDLSQSSSQRVHAIHTIHTDGLASALGLPPDWAGGRSVQAYEVNELPGLHIVPSLLDCAVQRQLLDRLLHRDLADPRHQSNVGKHYRIPYEVCSNGASAAGDQTSRPKEAAVEESARVVASFFACGPSSDVDFRPFDSSLHKNLSISQFLNRKLRWITLGGQYDWTRKVYPEGTHPDFPPDIAAAVSAVFPQMRPESAICNLYTPGDTLSLHRDVAEETNVGLASISIGCDALFVVGLAPEGEGDAPTACAAIRLRSGDAVYMSGPSRFAWHGVPQVLRNTCPEDLASWPASSYTRTEGPFADWRGWLANKRINLNVRQMRE